jgi:histidinol-phosphate aminotransferase
MTRAVFRPLAHYRCNILQFSSTNLKKSMMNRRQWMQSAGALVGGLTLQSHLPFSGQQSNGPIILRNNENPYGPSPKVMREVGSRLSRMNRYHWEDSSQLVDALATKHRVPVGNVSLGAGSTELLDLLAARTHADRGTVILGDPSYDYWLEPWIGQGLQVKRIPVRSDKGLDLQAMLGAMDTSTRLLYICNPNNPTGTVLTVDAILDVLKRLPGEVILAIDEAYIDYTDQPSAIPLTARFPNLVVLRTFSKIDGLAGARVGYAVAQEALLQSIDQYRSSSGGSVAVPSRWAAYYALQDKDFRMRSKAGNEKVRAYTAAQLNQMGLTCIPSVTNFLYFSLAKFPRDYFKVLSDHHIQGTRIYEEKGQWTRITIGTENEMKAFIKVLGS